MTAVQDTAQHIAQAVLTAPRRGRRRVVALAGPPASGKSTMADHLADALTAKGCAGQVVPMDGFHLDNTILTARGLLPRKGAPQTFDARGFVALVSRLADGFDVVYPKFDRSRDLAVAGAGVLDHSCDTVIVEGNYLLIDQPVWRDLTPYWDLRIFLKTPQDVLRHRLIQRWLDHGMSAEAAKARAEQNDLPNALFTLDHTRTADIWI